MKIATNQTAKTIHFARRPAGKVKNEPLTGPASLSEQVGQLSPGGYWCLAGESLADVRGGLARDGRPGGEEGRARLSLGAARENQARPELGADDAGEGGEVVADERHL